MDEFFRATVDRLSSRLEELAQARRRWGRGPRPSHATAWHDGKGRQRMDLAARAVLGDLERGLGHRAHWGVAQVMAAEATALLLRRSRSRQRWGRRWERHSQLRRNCFSAVLGAAGR